MNVINSIISKQHCDFLINLLEYNLTLTRNHRDTTVIDIYPIIPFKQESQCIDLVKYVNSLITYEVKKICKNSYINYSQIVKWPEGSYQPEHLDFDCHTYTSILYLNDNFIGGETFVEDRIFKPKAGSIIIFKGNKKTHGVTKVEKSTRYTLPTWFKTFVE
jgi:hypothetical protein